MPKNKMGLRSNKSRLFLILLLLLVPCVQCEEKVKYSSALFEPSPLIKVSGPTMFPKPTYLFNDPNLTVVVEPTFGKHRKGHNAVFAYAEGYALEYYRFFIETLMYTGFLGDIVLAISDANLVRPNVVDYLKTYSEEVEKDNGHGLNVVVYMHELKCFDKDLKTRIGRRKKESGDLDIFQMCTLDNVYGYKDLDSGKVTVSVPDVRHGRVVATLRYEWYWIWSLQYNPHTWLLLLDARDTYFQANPFENLKQTKRQTFGFQQDHGYIYFYGENHEATRLGISTKNRNWIKNGYGDKTMEALMDKPTICSGSTMGQNIAIETYLRAMINEWDETNVNMMGSDQGFHNYLYYSSKLLNALTIKAIIVWEQGKGIVNNLAALRDKPLKEWGVYHPDDHKVYQWDNTTLSPVVHQWDRDKELNSYNQLQRMHNLKTWSKNE